MNSAVERSFLGCKLALMQGLDLLVSRRDQKDGIPFPGMLDLPGGGREGDETPEECVLRELEEEFGLRLAVERLLYRQRYEPSHLDGRAYFFAASLSPEEISSIRFGTEGTGWQLLPVSDYLLHPEAVPHLKRRLQDYLNGAMQT